MQRPGGATPGQLVQQDSTAINGSILSGGSDRPPRRARSVRDVVNLPVRAHRVRVPDGLLISRQHSATAVMLYAVADLLAHPGSDRPGRERAGLLDDRAPRELVAGREWLGRRVGLASASALGDALDTLARPHDGGGLGETHPAYLVARRSRRVGGGSVAVRAVSVCAGYTEVPAWSTGDAGGPLVDATAWRLYIATVKHRGRDGVCRLGAGQLAEVIRVRRQAIRELLERLRDAGLVVTVSAPGKPTLVLPLMVPVDDVRERAALADEIATACGYLPADWRRRWASDRCPPGPVTGARGGPETGAPRETQGLETPSPDTARGGPPDPPRLADPFPAAAAPPDPGRRWRQPPSPLYRYVREQLAARRAAQRGTAHPGPGLAETG
jgi:hypothetical protein